MMRRLIQSAKATPPALAAILIVLLSLDSTAHVAAQQPPALSSNATVFATGLDEPRGLSFGSSGLTGSAATDLYVAEAGHGGTLDTAGLSQTSFGACLAAGPEAPHSLGGYTGRISMINAAGQRTTIVNNLPSGMDSNGSAVGPADVEFVNGVLYGLLDAGCDNANRDVPSGIIQIANNGSWSIFDLSTWAQQHPSAHPDPGDYAPDGSWYSMTQANGNLYTVNPNGGQMVELVPQQAQFREIADLSSSQGWVGPTGITYHNGNFYVVTLGSFPMHQGAEKVLKIAPDGTVSVYATGLTAAVSLAFDPTGKLYVLETFTGTPFPGPSAIGTGRVVSINPGAAPQTVLSGLTFPTAMTFGPDGMLYVSNIGYGLPGQGQVVRVNVAAGG
jgi:hypothetical protein